MPTTPTRPEKEPPQTGATSSGGGQPQLEPPASAQEQHSIGTSRPVDITPEMAALADQSVAGGAAPSLQPPAELASGYGAIGAWQSDKRIVGLWSINQDRNSWVSISGVGWKKLSTASASGIISLTMLAAHARQVQAAVNYREEADTMIHEMYVW